MQITDKQVGSNPLPEDLIRYSLSFTKIKYDYSLNVIKGDRKKYKRVSISYVDASGAAITC